MLVNNCTFTFNSLESFLCPPQWGAEPGQDTELCSFPGGPKPQQWLTSVELWRKQRHHNNSSSEESMKANIQKCDNFYLFHLFCIVNLWLVCWEVELFGGWSDCSSSLSHPISKHKERGREGGREGGREQGRESYNADRQICCMRRKRACNAHW